MWTGPQKPGKPEAISSIFENRLQKAEREKNDYGYLTITVRVS